MQWQSNEMVFGAAKCSLAPHNWKGGEIEAFYMYAMKCPGLP